MDAFEMAVSGCLRGGKKESDSWGNVSDADPCNTLATSKMLRFQVFHVLRTVIKKFTLPDVQRTAYRCLEIYAVRTRLKNMFRTACKMPHTYSRNAHDRILLHFCNIYTSTRMDRPDNPVFRVHASVALHSTDH